MSFPSRVHARNLRVRFTLMRVCVYVRAGTQGDACWKARVQRCSQPLASHICIYIYILVYMCVWMQSAYVSIEAPFRGNTSFVLSVGEKKKKKRTRRYVSNYEPGRDWAHWSLPPLTRQFKQGISFFHILFSFLSFLFLFSRKRETLSFDFVRNYVSTSCPLDSLSLSREREKVNFSQIFLYLNNLWNDSRKEKQKKER